MTKEDFNLDWLNKEFIITWEWIAIVILMCLLAIMYIVHTKDIAACNAYYQGIMDEMRKNVTSVLWNGVG